MENIIKEIARTICGLNTRDGCFCDGGYCNYNCLSYEKAEALYNAGYRKQEWTSVDERLPEANGACIVCRFDGYVYKTFFSGTFSKTITHWMPLPEAPKMKGGAE